MTVDVVHCAYGDRFEEYVVGRGQALLRFGYVLIGDRQLSQDLVQDALVKAHCGWSPIVTMDHPEAYVRRIIVNGFLSWRRKNARLSFGVEEQWNSH